MASPERGAGAAGQAALKVSSTRRRQFCSGPAGGDVCPLRRWLGSYRLRPVPFEGSLQTFFDRETRGVSQVLNGEGSVRHRVPHVALARRSKAGRYFHAFHVLQGFPDELKREAAAVRSEERRVGKECRSRWSRWC